MTALPRQHELDRRINCLPFVTRAYPMILQLEQSAKDNRELVHARTLGYLIIHGPSDEARKTVAREVNSCDGDEIRLGNLGRSYVEHYIRGFKRYNGRTPTPSSHSSRSSFDITKDAMSSRAPTQHQAAKRKALRRDNFRCVVTGATDVASALSDPELQQTGLLFQVTHCAHIFPESTNVNISGDGNSKHDYAAPMWAVMTRFGYEDLPRKLNGNNIHCLENILTLEGGTMHWHFDMLRLWFEPTGIADKYNICWSQDLLERGSGAPSTVQFTTPDPEEFPLPSPTYLRIHAACAKVAKLSGAGDYIDNLSRELEELRVLSNDGTSAELLEHALLPLSSDIQVF
ncbi:hypothetical protein BU15DRAFT_90278 [Melanogaster broomeanus]|nr:hypothetical protein BU15DRAFT_90278 [Melanogaster broomeanus]